MSDERHEPDLAMLTGMLLFSVQQELFETLAQQDHPHVRPRHGAVLAYLDPGGTRATDLAHRSGQHKQIIGTIVDELERLGYIHREPDPRDRRAKLIVPTPHGMDENTKARAILASIEQRHRQALGAETYANFKATFQRLVRLQRAWRPHHNNTPATTPTANPGVL